MGDELKIVEALLRDLGNSSWADVYPQAYLGLCEYKTDMALTITKLGHEVKRPSWFLQADWDRCTDIERKEILANKQAYLDGHAIGGFKNGHAHT